MDEVIAKLGSDAMIVSTRRVENGVEITATSDVLDLSNRIVKSTTSENERREPREIRPIPTIRSQSVKMNEVENDKVSSRKRLIEEIEALLDEHGVSQAKSLNPFLDRYVNFFEVSTRFTTNFCSRKYLLSEFIEEFVSDIVAEREIRLDETRQLFVIGNNGVGKSTFSSKLCKELRKKSSGAEVQIIEANNKGYSSSTLLSVSAKMMNQKYSTTPMLTSDIKYATITEMNISQFVQSIEKEPKAKNAEVVLTVPSGMHYDALSKILRAVALYRPKIAFTKLDEQDLSVEELMAVYNFGLKVVFLSADEKLSEGLCYATKDILTWFLSDRITES
jgi:flagellar biosynthesis GTPase FlhF